MKTRTLAMITALAIAGAAGSLAAQSAQAVRLAVQPESKLWIEGSSNVHDWSCKASDLEASIDVDANFANAGALATGSMLQRVSVKVPVSALKCGNGQMDKNLQKALRSDEHPSVSYIMGSFETLPATAAGFAIRAEGQLTVAGAQRTVTMDVSAVPGESGQFRAIGEVPLLMTDFGVNPPRAMLGALRTGNKVVVKFDLLVSRRSMVASATGDQK